MNKNENMALIADDHEMIRESLRASLSEMEKFNDICIACNGAEVLALLDAHNTFSLIVLDLFMPKTDGFALLTEVCERCPDTPVVILSGSDDVNHMHKVIDIGAAGYIPKSFGRAVMLSALQLVMSGGTYIPPDMIRMPQPGRGDPDTPVKRGLSEASDIAAKLTERQQDVLKFLVQGKSNKLIAHHLDLSEHTVKAHVRAIFSALNVNNRTQAVVVAQQLGYKPDLL